MQELQILGILADLTIFLISVTIPTYAIAVSFFGPDYAKAVERIANEKAKLEADLSKPVKTGTVRLEDLEKKIDDFRKKEKKMRSRFNPLSLYPTIVFPNIPFALSLLTILNCVYSNAENFLCHLVVSLIFVVAGIIILGRSLIMIQRATKETV